MFGFALRATALACVALAFWTTSSSAEKAVGPEWTCQRGSGYCCDCVWADTYRQCNPLAEPGNYYDRCGVSDGTPCTGNCLIVS